MSPHANMTPEQIHQLLLDYAAHPASEETLRLLPAYDPSDPHQNPDFATQLEPSGVPVWWPRKDPETLEPVTSAERLDWCLTYLAGAWTPMRDELESDSPNERRLAVAQSLLLTQSELATGEVPTRASL